MFRKAVPCALVALFVGVGFAGADQFFGNIVKVEKGKITIATHFDKEANRYTREKTYSVAVDVKVLQGRLIKNKVESGAPVKDGLLARVFRKLTARGVRVHVTTNDQGEVTEIHLLPREDKK
jgi:hypothetical protein